MEIHSREEAFTPLWLSNQESIKIMMCVPHQEIKGNIIKNKKVKGETNTHLNTDMQILNSTVEAKMTETELSTNGTVCGKQ